MSIDCQWVEKNLEALFCDGLNADEARLARTHIENCANCRTEVAALNAIDPLVKKYFQQQMTAARVPQRARRSVIFGTAAAAIVALLLVALTLRAPEVNIINPPAGPTIVQTNAPPSVGMPEAVKTETAPDTARAKPEPAPPADALPQARVVAPDQSAPEFVVADVAGQSNTLNEYRGRIAVIGVWGADQPEATANFEVLYKTLSSNTKLRFVGVTNAGVVRARNTTFPMVYNQGSRLLGLQPGEFAVVDERGSIELRGSLVKDFDNLRQLLQGK
jgi:hypothetical protein